MSSPSYTWGDIVNYMIQAVQETLYQAAKWMLDNIAWVVSAVAGVGVAAFVWRRLGRIGIGRFINRIFGLRI